MELEGSVVLISGASAGIGHAAARAFVAAGARVIGLARSAERLAEIEAELGAARFLAIPADVSSERSMAEATQRVLGAAGTPHVVVANAGIGFDALFQNTGDEELRALFEVNVFGAARTLRPFVPGMIERGSGRILIVSSVVGKRGLPYYSAYSASKFALHGMADALRAELVGTGVSVGIVCPSTTESEFQARMRRAGPSQRRRRLRSHSSDSVARVLVRMARTRRRQIVLTPEGKLIAFAAIVAPGLVDRLLASALVGPRRA